jgi:5-methylcytosine-specific restriction endonuclease McrA
MAFDYDEAELERRYKNGRAKFARDPSVLNGEIGPGEYDRSPHDVYVSSMQLFGCHEKEFEVSRFRHASLLEKCLYGDNSCTPSDYGVEYWEMMMVDLRSDPSEDDDGYLGPTSARYREVEWKMKAGAPSNTRDLPEPVSVSQVNWMNARRASDHPYMPSLTGAHWHAIIDAYEGRCAYCAKRSALTMDHVIPVSKGGHHTLDNVVPACRPCNSSKSARDMEDWLDRRKDLCANNVLARIRSADAKLGVVRSY